MNTFLSLFLGLQLLLASAFPSPAILYRQPQNVLSWTSTQQDTQTQDKDSALASSITAPSAVLMEASTRPYQTASGKHYKNNDAYFNL